MKIRTSQRNDKPVWELDTGLVDEKRRYFFINPEKAAQIKLAAIESDFEAAGRRWTRSTASLKTCVIRSLDEIAERVLPLGQVWDGCQSSSKTAGPGVGKELGEAVEEVCESKRAANRRPLY